MHILKQIKISHDMGHELLENLRRGDWFIEYTRNRLLYMEEELGQTISLMD